MITSLQLTHNEIMHGFFTRDEPHVLGGLPVVTCKQVHSAVVHVIGAAPISSLVGDALVTREKNLAIGVLTADCAPVLLMHASSGVIGVAHAGWRGALSGIIGATLAAMESCGAKRSYIDAAIGPCIRQQSYEIGPEVFAQFMHDDYENAIFFKPSPTPDHQWFDLAGYVRRRLQQAGVGRIDVLSHNTYTEEALFHSFRRSSHRKEAGYGNQISAIVRR